MAKTIKTGTTGNCTWTLDTNGLLTISGNGAMGNYTHLSSSPWRKNIKSVVIENGGTTIGERTFRNCTSLTSVTIPNSIKSIDDWAFDTCTNLTSVIIPNSVTTIGKCAFGYYWDTDNESDIKIDDFTIYCNKDSAAEKYAKERGINYVTD